MTGAGSEVETFRALVIGCGMVGGGYNTGPDDELVMTHALAYRRHPKFSLSACVDPNAEARQSFMRRWSVPHGFATVDEAMASGLAFDVASVTAPTSEHIAILRRLLVSPVRAVFAEKPLGGDPVEAARVVAAYEEAGKPLLVGYLRRFDPSMQSLRDEIARGEWGTVRTIVALYGRGVMNNGSHLIDLVGFLTGERPIETVFINGVRPDGVSGDPTVDATLQVEGGPLIHLAAGDGRDYALFETSLICSDGIVDIEDGGLSIRRRRAIASNVVPGTRRLDDGARQATRWGEAYRCALDGLLHALSTGKKPVSNGATALAALKVCDSLRRATSREAAFAGGPRE
jgi:predicted dehydrogenase